MSAAREPRPFGATGLRFPQVGLGAAAAGDPGLPDAEAEQLLNGALDLGVALLDTARSYGLSEERIGRFLSRRRSEVVLSTKVGYGVPGCEDWTGRAVEAGVDRALRALRTDSIDVVHLHSCPLETLRRGAVVEALSRAVAAGKARVAAYSGDNEALEWAVDSGFFGSVQASVSVCDQKALVTGTLRRASERGLGVLAKRPLANAPWRADDPPGEDDAARAYRERWREMALDLGGMDADEFALRFTLSQPEVDAAILGTRRLEHLRRALQAAGQGPLPEELRRAAAEAFARCGAAWEAQT